MPQIPTYTAQGKAVEQDYPRDVPVQDYTGLNAAGQQLQKIGQQTGQIADYYRQAEEKIQALRVKNNVTGVTSNYDAGLKSIEEELQLDGLINSREAAEAKFIEREKKLRKDSFTNAETPAAKFALDTHIKGTLPQHFNNARYIGNVKATQWNLGQLEINRDRLMNLAAQEVDPTRALKYEQEYQNLLLEATNKSHIKPEKYASDIASFRSGVYDKKADILLNGDDGPGMFRAAVKNEIFGHLDSEGQWKGMDLTELTKKAMKANEIEHTKQIREDQEHKKQTTVVKRDWDVRLHSGTLSDEWIQDAQKGNNPYILPHEADQFAKDKLFPPNPAADLAVRTLRQEYRSDPTISEARVEEFSRRAKNLGIKGQNQELSMFYNELQSDTTSARNLTIQATNKAVTRGTEAAKDTFRTPVIPGASRMNTFLKSLDAESQHQVNKALRDARNAGKSPEEIEAAGQEKIAEIMKKKADAASKIPDNKKKRFQIYED